MQKWKRNAGVTAKKSQGALCSPQSYSSAQPLRRSPSPLLSLSLSLDRLSRSVFKRTPRSSLGSRARDSKRHPLSATRGCIERNTLRSSPYSYFVMLPITIHYAAHISENDRVVRPIDPGLFTSTHRSYLARGRSAIHDTRDGPFLFLSSSICSRRAVSWKYRVFSVSPSAIHHRSRSQVRPRTQSRRTCAHRLIKIDCAF